MLKDKEKVLIAELWTRLIPKAEDIGSEALLRCKQTKKLGGCNSRYMLQRFKMFTSYPGSKTYFSHIDIGPCSPHLLSHGRKIILAIAEGAQDISQLAVSLEPLQTLHAYQLRIHPRNFKLFSHCMLVTLACNLGEEFTPVAHAAVDKYLSAFAAVLAEKYR